MRTALNWGVAILVAVVMLAGMGAAISVPGGGFSGVLGAALDAAGNRIYDSTDELNLGKAAEGANATTTDDVVIGGKLEVDGNSYLDGNVTLAGTGIFNGTMYFGDVGGADVLYMRGVLTTLGTDSLTFEGTTADDYELVIRTDPTADRVQTFPDRTGTIALLDHVVAAAPSEPFACASATTGHMVYVDDNDDTTSAGVCICAIGADDSTADWRALDDIAGTACPFF
jgi:hypothetical protein